MANLSLKTLVMTVLACGLAACGTISRPEDGVVRMAAHDWTPAQDPRIRASDAASIEILARDLSGRLASEGPSPAMLALSGGGANGAFGAGVLVGWTQKGDRPSFAVVTGVSTGALAAPFAFLGPDWDEELEAAYAEGRTQGLLSWRSLTAFVAPGLFSPGTLDSLVDEFVTPELLRQIAIEHAKGRRLLIVTTNLDAEETVIWDMGVLATQGGEQARSLFRQVLLASASIPGVFPPVLIAGVDEQGRVVQEMHVDGGVNTPFLGIPESMLLASAPSRAPSNSALYVLVNGQVGRDHRIVRGALPSILARTYDSMSKASLRTSLAANLGYAERNGIHMYVAAIPDGVQASSLDFGPDSMKAMFERGRALAAAGNAWSRRDGLAAALAPTPTVVVAAPETAVVETPKP